MEKKHQGAVLVNRRAAFIVMNSSFVGLAYQKVPKRLTSNFSPEMSNPKITLAASFYYIIPGLTFSISAYRWCDLVDMETAMHIPCVVNLAKMVSAETSRYLRATTWIGSNNNVLASSGLFFIGRPAGGTALNNQNVHPCAFRRPELLWVFKILLRSKFYCKFKVHHFIDIPLSDLKVWRFFVPLHLVFQLFFLF